jgi:hypothetical protein
MNCKKVDMIVNRYEAMIEFAGYIFTISPVLRKCDHVGSFTGFTLAGPQVSCAPPIR